MACSEWKVPCAPVNTLHEVLADPQTEAIGMIQKSPEHGLELMSLALYVVAASNRDNAKSTEAGLKYFVLGALSSGMLLYGASLAIPIPDVDRVIAVVKANAYGHGAVECSRALEADGAGFQRALKRIALAADAAYAGQDLALFLAQAAGVERGRRDPGR